MDRKRRVDLRGILAKPDLRRELMIPTLQATQAREGIETTREQAERAYYVVTETERAAFFDLQRFKARKGHPERRHHAFVASLRAGDGRVRFDIARRDFATIETSPLAYQRIAQVAHLFREHPTILPHHGSTHVGVFTHDDARFLRERWECPRGSARWVPFTKGGDYCRFYYDSSLAIDWSTPAQAYYRSEGRLRDVGLYFRGGLTWVPRTQRGFSVRVLPNDAIFGNKGPTLLPARTADTFYLLGVLNSWLFDYLTQLFAAFGSYEAKSIERLPVPEDDTKHGPKVAELALAIYAAKEEWDCGNEISRSFRSPWILQGDLATDNTSISARLLSISKHESEGDSRIQALFGELNERVYRLYRIPDAARAAIEETLGERPPEVLWPQMEGKTAEQKRMEHVFRLLSYAVKRVVEADEDGIVPFAPVAGEPSLADRVHRELQALFPKLDIGQVEVEIANELKKNVKGYRRTAGIADWLGNAFFEFHCSLYKNRPIFWHIASSQGTSPFAFGALAHYHRFDKNRMGQLRGQYLRDAIEVFRREAALADKAGKTDARQDWQARLEEAQELDRRLQWVQEGRHEGPEGGDRDYRILTPWKAPKDRPNGWAPDLDDGVKVNIEPLQKAGVLRIGKVI